MRINYNWFGVKRSYPHYHYYLTRIDNDTWVVEDIKRPNADAPDRICYSDLFHGKWIDLITDHEGVVPNTVIESVLKYVEDRHFSDWVYHE